MTNIAIFKNLKGRVLSIPDTDWIDGAFAKSLRVEYFHMSQNAFSEALGVSKKTVEAWESGRNQPEPSTRKLLYLLREKPELMKELYHFEDESDYMSFFGKFHYPVSEATKIQGLLFSSNTEEDIIPTKELSYGA